MAGTLADFHKRSAEARQMGLLLTAHLAEQRCSILPSGQLGGGHSFCLIIRYQEPSSDLHWEILTENNLILISCLGPRKSASPLGRTNLSKSGPNEPYFFLGVGSCPDGRNNFNFEFSEVSSRCSGLL